MVMRPLQKMTAIFPLVILASLAQEQPKTWPKEPDGFLGVKFLSSQAEASRIVADSDRFRQGFVGSDCHDIITRGERNCRKTISLLPSCRLDVTFSFVDDKLRLVAGTFTSEHYTEIKDVFIERYGSPSSTEASVVQTRTAAKYEKESLWWIGETVILNVQKYGTDIENGIFVLQLVEDVKAKAKTDSEQKKQAADKL